MDVPMYCTRCISGVRFLPEDKDQNLPPPAKKQKHTTGGIPRWSPTLVLVARFSAYVWQSGRDAQFSLTYGRMCLLCSECTKRKFSIFWPMSEHSGEVLAVWQCLIRFSLS